MDENLIYEKVLTIESVWVSYTEDKYWKGEVPTRMKLKMRTVVMERLIEKVTDLLGYFPSDFESRVDESFKLGFNSMTYKSQFHFSEEERATNDNLEL